MRRSLRINIGANIVGRVFTAVCGVVFAPIYLHFLGIAEYGLFALLNSYMIVAALVDLGFSGAMTREIAKLSAVSPERMRDLVWTISLPYCAVGLALAIALYCASPWIASLVLSKEDSISDAAVIQAVGFAGVGLACQLPAFLFGGGLADFRLGAGAEALGDLQAHLDDALGARRGERLRVRVGDDEIHADEPGHDHVVDRVAACAADAANHYAGLQFP